jgi:hypothetical protein
MFIALGDFGICVLSISQHAQVSAQQHPADSNVAGFHRQPAPEGM